MEISVKEVKILKKGENKFGPWNLVLVTTEDTEYTTLAKEADIIKPGSIVNITDMDKDEKGRESFKKFELLSVGKLPEKRDGDSMSKDDWSQKQAIERASIESQTAYKGIIELLNNKVIELDHEQAKQALAFASARLGGNEQGIQEVRTRLAPDKESLPLDNGKGDLPEFKDGVALVNFATKKGEDGKQLWTWENIKLALHDAGMTVNNPTEMTDVPKAVAILFPDKVE